MIIHLYDIIKEHPGHFKQLKCRDLLFTQYDCPQEVSKQDLFSASSFITYVLKGKRVFHLPGERYTMSAGKCVFAKKGGWIAEKEPAEGWCVLVFFIPDSYLKKFLEEHRTSLPLKGVCIPPPLQMFELDVNPSTGGFFRSMIPYFDQTPPPPESLVELKFRELLLNILINPANAALLAWMCHIAESEKQPLQEVMEANYTYNLSLRDFARIAGRSIASFKREFFALYQTTPGKWLIQKRIAYAGLLLETSGKPVNEIAFESGFEDATHFSRVFKEKFGMSPLKYRADKTQHS